GHGEGDRRRDLAGDGDATQAGGRPSDRRGWTRRDLVLRGRTLPGAEGGLDAEGAPRGHVLELGDPDARLDPLSSRGPAARRNRWHSERARCGERDRAW